MFVESTVRTVCFASFLFLGLGLEGRRREGCFNFKNLDGCVLVEDFAWSCAYCLVFLCFLRCACILVCLWGMLIPGSGLSLGVCWTENETETIFDASRLCWISSLVAGEMQDVCLVSSVSSLFVKGQR